MVDQGTGAVLATAFITGNENYVESYTGSIMD